MSDTADAIKEREDAKRPKPEPKPKKKKAETLYVSDDPLGVMSAQLEPVSGDPQG